MHLAACILNGQSVDAEIPEAELLTGDYSKLNQMLYIVKGGFDHYQYNMAEKLKIM